MTIIVTGANGFVGRTMCRRALEKGLQVRGTVRSAKDADSLPVGVETVQINSIGPDTDWSSAFTDVDTVIHLAARVHMTNDTAPDPLAAFREVNVAGTERLARMAAKAGVKRFIYLSSVKVNGEGSQVPYSEQDTPMPSDPYGISKLEAEQVLNSIADSTNLEVIILRPPLVYGPHVKANFLRLLELIRKGIPLPLALINNKRSMIYLENLVDAIAKCIEHPNAANQTFLVSDGQDISTPDLIKMIAKEMGKRANLIPFPPAVLKMIGKITGKGAEIDRLTGSLQIDSSKIRTLLNWNPPYTVEEGISETVKWYLKQA